MLQVESQTEVLHLLQNFNGTEPLKELFWSTLNYDRINRPTTRRGWPEAAAAALVDDPTLLAAGGAHGEFQVLYSRLAKDRLSLADERIVTSRLLKDHPYSLFVFSDRQQANWHFLNVTLADDEAKRKLFRRITVGPNEKMRTASQIISQLDLTTISPNLFGFAELQESWPLDNPVKKSSFAATVASTALFGTPGAIARPPAMPNTPP